eukprot:Gb_21747 [translate_table: standard]
MKPVRLLKERFKMCNNGNCPSWKGMGPESQSLLISRYANTLRWPNSGGMDPMIELEERFNVRSKERRPKGKWDLPNPAPAAQAQPPSDYLSAADASPRAHILRIGRSSGEERGVWIGRYGLPKRH